MKKRFLSLALALVLCLGLLPLSVFAANSDFIIENGELTGYKGNGGDVAIPSGVTSIGEFAFWGCKDLTSVTIPSSVTNIRVGAFQYCGNLTSVTIPSSVTNVGDGAFLLCTALTNINIPSSVTKIGASAFKGCTALASVSIPYGVTSIGEGAFQLCSGLTNVTIPSSVTSIENKTFDGCTRLISITIPSSVTQIGGLAFSNCTNLTSATIPVSVTSIDENAFSNCNNLKNIYYGGTDVQWKSILEQNWSRGGFNADTTIHYNSTSPSTQPEQPQQPAASAAANPTNDSLTADGAAQNPTVYKIGESNYFKIRDLAAILNGTEKQFSVGYDAALNSVTATTGQGYAKQPGDLAGAASGGGKTAQPSNDTIYVNGKKVDAEVYKIDGSNYFKLRDLGKALNFYVGWTAERGMYIETDKPYSE